VGNAHGPGQATKANLFDESLSAAVSTPHTPGVTVIAWPWCWRVRQRDTAGTAHIGYLESYARHLLALAGEAAERVEKISIPIILGEGKISKAQ
jgi:hypothetical protein